MPWMLASKIVRAAPRTLPVEILRMNSGISMLVGHAVTHGASWQYRQRFASITAWSRSYGALKSVKAHSLRLGSSLAMIVTR